MFVFVFNHKNCARLLGKTKRSTDELKKEPKFQTTGKPGNWSPKWQDGMPAPGV